MYYALIDIEIKKENIEYQKQDLIELCVYLETITKQEILDKIKNLVSQSIYNEISNFLLFQQIPSQINDVGFICIFENETIDLTLIIDK